MSKNLAEIDKIDQIPEKKAKQRPARLQQRPPSFRDANQKRLLDSLEDKKKKPLILSPSQRIHMLLYETVEDDEYNESHPIFTEMLELNDQDSNQEWTETARWIKFEEDVESGGNRWSKPHVSTLSLHSWFELRSCFMTGVVMLDMEAVQYTDIVEMVLDKFVSTKRIDSEQRDALSEVFGRKRVHQQGAKIAHALMSRVRSIAEIGRNFSKDKSLGAESESTDADGIKGKRANEGSIKRKEIARDGSFRGKDLAREGSFKSKEIGREASFRGGKSTLLKANLNLMKKMPVDAEATNVLVAHLSFLERPLSAFIRLKTPILLSDLTEVPLLTRFVFILLGEGGHEEKYHEIGRAMGAIMIDEVFHEVAYKARHSNDLVDGVDEFLDQATILPPGEWDPSIRIEPPALPSHDNRKLPTNPSMDHIVTTDNAQVKKIEMKSEEVKIADAVTESLTRTGRPFGCLMNDVKRKIVFYKSDFKDALNLQCFATFLFMYFALLAPLVTFGGLYKESTGRRLAVVESLLGCSISGIIYSLFSAQPMTIIASTGPILVFEKIIFDMCKDHLDYLSFRYWIIIWSVVILFIIVATDSSTIVRYITRFTEECFTVLVSVMFIVKAITKMFSQISSANVIPFDKHLSVKPYCACVDAKRSLHEPRGNVSEYSNLSIIDVSLSRCSENKGQLENPFGFCYWMYDVLLMSMVLAIGTFCLAYFFKSLKNSIFFPTQVRRILHSFGVIISIVVMVLMDAMFGLATPKLYIPPDFQPTYRDREWLVNPLSGNPWWSILLAIVPAFFLSILIFIDHNVTVVVVNRKENKLRKGCGYHLDLFVLLIGCLISATLGVPIFVAATIMSIGHVHALRQESEHAPGEKPQLMATREQRVTSLLVYICIGLSVFLTNVLTYIPMSVLYGVFLFMGVSALEELQFLDRLFLFLIPAKYQPDYSYLRHVPILRVHLFTLCQLGCLVAMYVVKEINIVSVAFPIVIIATVVVRKLLERVFSAAELEYLDDAMPEMFRRKHEDDQKQTTTEHRPAPKNKLAALGAMQSEANLHIPLMSGGMIRIPLANIGENVIDISREVNRSGVWKRIATETSFGSKDHLDSTSPRDKSNRASGGLFKLPAVGQTDGSGDEDDVLMIKFKQP